VTDFMYGFVQGVGIGLMYGCLWLMATGISIYAGWLS
jgi:hypothetical protein